MDQIGNDKKDGTFVFNNNGLDVYSNETNVIQGQPSLDIPYDSVNATCSYPNDFVMNDNIVPVLHTTTSMTPFTIDGCVDWYPTSSDEVQDNHNTDIEQNHPQSVVNTTSSLPDNMTPQIQTSMAANNPEIYRFVIPGFQIVVIPTSSPFAVLNDFDMQYQFQQDHTFSSQSYQDVSGVRESTMYETPGGSSVNIHQSQHHHNSLN